MVSLLRRPFGFALMYVLLAFLIGHITVNYVTLNDYAGNGIVHGSLVVFTLIYVFLVVAHLSNSFRLRASMYISLLGLIASLAIFLMYNPLMFMGALQSLGTWLGIVIQFVISYVLITIGNWFAGFFVKSKGHI